jgi:hypothetical protein
LGLNDDDDDGDDDNDDDDIMDDVDRMALSLPPLLLLPFERDDVGGMGAAPWLMMLLLLFAATMLDRWNR